MIVQRFLQWQASADVAKRTAAASALGRAYLQCDMPFEERVAAEAALSVVVEDPSPKVRMALAEALALSAHAPEAVITGLMYDQVEIASLVIARSPVLRDSDLIARLRSGDRRLQTIIAARPQMSPALAKAISLYGGEAAALVLVENWLAVKAFEIRQTLVERFSSNAQLRGALLDFPDLEPVLRYRLMRASSNALSGSTMIANLFGAETADHMGQSAHQRALVDLLGPMPREQMDMMIDGLRDGGDLTTVLLVRCVCHGRIDFLARVLALLAGIDQSRVTSILVSERNNQLRALLTNAGLPDNVQPVFVTAIKLWRHIAQGKIVMGEQEVTKAVMDEVADSPCAAHEPANDDLLALLRSIYLDTMRQNAKAHANALAKAA